MSEVKTPANLPDWIADHRREYLESGGKQGHLWDSSPVGGPGLLPCLLLTTTGRHSGQPQTMPLIYGKSGSAYIVVASKGGAPRHPAWYLNLAADPAVRLQVGTTPIEARARTLAGAERTAEWQAMLEIYPPYAAYQKRTEREIPVVALEPVEA